MPITIQADIDLPQASNVPEILDGYIQRAKMRKSSYSGIDHYKVQYNLFLLSATILFYKVSMSIHNVIQEFNLINQFLLNTIISVWVFLILVICIVLTVEALVVYLGLEQQWRQIISKINLSK